MAQATGGTLQYAKIGSTWYRTHIFTSTDNLVITEPGDFRYLCVAGGGGGGNDMGGGGGGGGVLNGTLSMSSGTYLITVGAGGSGAPAGTGGLGTNGENSSIGSLVETIGGGRGASQHNGNTWNAGNGGSGGGGSGGRQSGGSFGGLPGTGTPGQGFNGAGSGPQWYPGGGGGAGGAGVGNGSVRGHGGPGKLDDILGVDYYWGGGGGGSGYSTTGGDGGIGGGGGGAVNTTSGGAGYNSGSPGGGGSVNSQTNRPGGNGGANTGGGGGGGSHFNITNNGGTGGSGIVVLSYEIPPPPNASGTGGTPYLVEQDGSWYLAHVFLESGTFTATSGGILEYLIVAGGGGGGGRHGGGGGGGGLISGLAEVNVQSYNIIVGAGGIGALTDVVGGTGTNSSAFNLIAIGGGGGGSFTGGSWSSGTNGGSGGGGGNTAGLSTGQGFNGGVRSNEEAGGGGGAAGVGENGSESNGGNGGPGKTNIILGGTLNTGFKWAGGGGGGAWTSKGGDGGAGGGGGGGAGNIATGNEGLGGSGGFNIGQAGVSGTQGAISGGAGARNTGGGGGGSGQRDNTNYTGVGGSGGSGIVVVRYLISTPNLASATGGVETQYELTPGKWYKVHTFNSNGNLEISQAGFLQYLVVAGGGGGGAEGGGGGGAGGLLTGFLDASTGTYSITVGPGGTGASSSTTAGTTGTNSSFHTFVAIGGGGGTSRSGGGSSTLGGSGAGGAGGSTRTTGAAGTLTQGNSGGTGFDSTTNSAGGGGGGSSTPGMNGGYQLSGRGGDGTLSLISGTAKYYAGGGAGGITTNGIAALGGLGGGGRGGISTTSAGTAGENNTGGGGGAGGTTGGSGGSGVVIVSYPIPTPPLTTIIQTSTVTITAGQLITPVTPISGTGGIGPRTFNISPTLPDGLIYNISNGEITGTAEDIFADQGDVQTNTYSVTVFDSTNTRSTSTFNLSIIYPPTADIVGGDVISYDINGVFFKAHKFVSSESLQLNTTATIEYLIVGGGGGGGSDMGGGGGAGGYLSGSISLSSGTYNVIVGAGGTGGPPGTDQVRANNGNSSSIVPVNYKGHSYIFDGAGDYISISGGMNVDAEDFTIQAWVYPVRWTVEFNSIFSTRATNSTAGATNVWVLGVHNSGYPYIFSGAFQITGSAGQVTLGSWTHLMVTRSGSTMRLFVNGILVQTSTSSQNYSSAPAAIGANRNGTEQWTGAISNLQIVKGTALYTTNFAVPSVPLGLETGTILLTAQDLSLKDNSTNNHTLTGVGNTETSHFNPFNNLGALGGGGGASDHSGPVATSAASWGGSGGGASGNNANSGLGVSGQGNNGSNSAGSWFPGGGGGAATAGSTNPANGGSGRLNNILGINYYWAGGGGGGGYSNWGGNGGLGGGGGGAPRTGTTQGIGDTNGINPGQDATAGSLNSQTNVPGGNGGTNTGGGGGGGAHFNSNNFGGTGGSGIVVIRYVAPPPPVETFKTTNDIIALNLYIPNSGITPVSAKFGTKPYTFSISPALPTGLLFNTSNGRITGQPGESVAATYSVTVTDAVGDVSTTNFFLTTSVNPLFALSLNAQISLSISSVFSVKFKDRTPASRVLNDLRLELRPELEDKYLAFGSAAKYENSERENKFKDLLISTGPGLSEIKYGTSLQILSIPNIVYGYTSTNFSLISVDHSIENSVNLNGKYQHYYGNVIMEANGSTVTNLISSSIQEQSLQDGNLPRPDTLLTIIVSVREEDTLNNRISNYFNTNNEFFYNTINVVVFGKAVERVNTAYSDLKLKVVNSFTPAEIVSQPIIKINIMQSPEPLRIKVDDFSAELGILNGEIEQITSENDPRLVTVQVPTFIEGQTGQPKQLWF